MRESWKKKKIEQCFKVRSGDFLPTIKMAKEGTIDVYGGNGIAGKHDQHNLTGENIVIGRVGAKCGNVKRVEGNIWLTDNAFYISEFLEKFNLRFLEHLLNTKNLRDTANQTAQPVISYKTIKNVILVVPPLPEQEQIVSIVDEAFEGIDRAIANTQKNLTNARDLFESYLNAIFTQKDNGWVEKKLLDVCQRITVGHVGSMKSEYLEGGVPFLRSQNILPFAVNLEKVAFIGKDFHDSLKKSKLKPGDVAIVRTGYPGTAAVIPESLPDSNCSDLVIVTPSSEVNPHYLCLFFNSAFGKNMVSGNLVGAAQKHFNVTAAKNVALPCPPISQQEQLVSMCNEFSAATQRLEAIYQRKLAALKELKQVILQKAFTGELTADTANQATKTAKEVIAA